MYQTLVLATLRAVEELFTCPHTWIQHRSAEDSKGNFVLPEEASAVCFCLIGAVDKFTHEGTLWDCYRELSISLSPLVYEDIKSTCCPKDTILATLDIYYGAIVAYWNDTPGRTVQEVLDLVRTTITRLECELDREKCKVFALKNFG